MRLSLLTAAAALALATALPAAAQTAPGPSAASAQAAAPRADSARVEGGEVRYFVHGDLASGATPVLVLHGAFMSSDAMQPLTGRLTGRPLIVIDQRGAWPDRRPAGADHL